MDIAEARQLLAAKVAELRRLPYGELLGYREPVCVEITGPSGGGYQLEVEAFWDDRKRGDLRVLASIDGGGWRALLPLCDGFIIAADGSFVGE
jgi:hypothetical protein